MAVQSARFLRGAATAVSHRRGPTGSRIAEHDAAVVTRARALAAQHAREVGQPDCADDAALIASELVTNALLHGDGCASVDVLEITPGIRIEVRDNNRNRPMVGHATNDSLTGRGIRLIATLSSRWGADIEGEGKVVWAEVAECDRAVITDLDEAALLEMWDDTWDVPDDEQRFHVEVGNVPTDLLLAAKSHVDSIIREFTLAATGAQTGTTAQIPAALSQLLEAVGERFAVARLSIKQTAER